MSARRIRLDALVGRMVHDADGRRIGRIHDFGAERRETELVIVDVYLGPAALLQRLGLSALRVVGLSPARQPLKIPWATLDLSDERRPRLISHNRQR